MITRVYIDNFRCFTNFEARPERINLLIGANGTGKSSFVEVLNGVAELIVMGGNAEEAFPPETYTRWDKRLTQRIEIDVTGDGGIYGYSVILSRNVDRGNVLIEREAVRYAALATEIDSTIGKRRKTNDMWANDVRVSNTRKSSKSGPPPPDLLEAAVAAARPESADLRTAPTIGKDEMLRLAARSAAGSSSQMLFMYDSGCVQLYDNNGNAGAQFTFKGDRSFLPQLEPSKENFLLNGFLEFLRTMWLVKLNPTEIDSESEDESDVLRPDGSNFASWFRHLSQERPEGLKRLFDRVAHHLPGFSSLRTVSSGRSGRRRELVADFARRRSDRPSQFFFDELSDGERAVIILYSILMDAEAEPRTLLLDEPENFVGLEVIQPWLVELADGIRQKGQLFVISHNPEGIDYLAADHTMLFERPGGGPSRIRSDPFNRNLGLKASEIVGRGLLDAK